MITESLCKGCHRVCAKVGPAQAIAAHILEVKIQLRVFTAVLDFDTIITEFVRDLTNLVKE